jgi:chromosome segregation protein
MYLSKLEIIGFKSFAQRTTLKFDPGMTAIVGPNGCGKSNVVDAIRWALGEQKASILRSDLMENVIFNGSRYRKPLGMAEVSLTIENTKGILPTEYQEVTITRRLFRSGESEYLLNKAQCRLKDIVELFMDTGMGANAYSVIELKMIEQILSDRTEDRRKLFEEAAGVTKYKARRKEALRRLDQVSDDLERIDDIIKEVTKNVASLERQAEKASKYNDVQQTLRTLEVDVIEREYSQSVSRIEPLRALLAQTNETRSSVIVEVERIEGLIDVVTREEEEIEERIRTTERALREKNETLSRLRETIAATEERIRSLKTQDERNTHEIARLESERTDEISARENATNSLVALSEDARVTAVDRDELQVRYDQRRGELDEKRQAMAAAQTNAASIIVERDSLSGETSRLRARIEELERRCTNINDEINRIVIQSRNLKEKEKEFSIAHENALRSLADAEQLRREAVSERESIKERIDSLQNESFVIQREIGERLSKIEFLTSLVERTLGTGDGAEFLLKNHSWSRTGTPKTVLDVVSTSAEYRAAIENCLGEAGHYFVAETRAEALDAIETLKHSQKGKATFIILDEIPVSSGVSHPGYTNALSVISCEPKYTPLFSLLVGDTVIAHDINEAFSLRTAGIANRFITRDGELVTIK